jgi:hypothetical protein
MKIVLGWILVVCWSAVVGGVLFLLLIPKPTELPGWFPGTETVRIFLIVLMLVSVAKGILWLYHRGMSHARRK